MATKSKDGITRIVTKKKGGRIMGETDVAKKIVTIHKGAHGKDKAKFSNRVINTIIHEEHHAKHPGATEKETYKAANAKERVMSPESKKKLLSKYGKQAESRTKSAVKAANAKGKAKS
jgi:hypothetical protein